MTLPIDSVTPAAPGADAPAAWATAVEESLNQLEAGAMAVFADATAAAADTSGTIGASVALIEGMGTYFLRNTSGVSDGIWIIDRTAGGQWWNESPSLDLIVEVYG